MDRQKYCCIIIFIICIFGIALFSCEEIFDEEPVRISFPRIDDEHTWEGQRNAHNKRRIFFINDDNIEHKDIDIQDTEIEIMLSKTTVLPVLACVIISTPQVDRQTNTLHNCYLASGGVYPFDKQKNALPLAPRHKATVAKMLLTLYQRNLNIGIINIKKLYDTIEKKSDTSPIDLQKIYNYIEKNKLSYWGIKSLPTHTITLPTTTHIWKSTSYWNSTITPSMTSLEFYEGSWAFISEDGTKTLQIHIDTDGDYSFVER